MPSFRIRVRKKREIGKRRRDVEKGRRGERRREEKRIQRDTEGLIKHFKAHSFNIKYNECVIVNIYAYPSM